MGVTDLPTTNTNATHLCRACTWIYCKWSHATQQPLSLLWETIFDNHLWGDYELKWCLSTTGCSFCHSAHDTYCLQSVHLLRETIGSRADTFCSGIEDCGMKGFPALRHLEAAERATRGWQPTSEQLTRLEQARGGHPTLHIQRQPLQSMATRSAGIRASKESMVW